MNYTNVLTITMENKEMTTKALEIMKKRLEAGFEIDNTYRRNPSMRMAADLEIQGNIITLPEESGYYMPEDSNAVFIELLKTMAAALRVDFSCSVYTIGDSSDSGLEATCENNLLTVEESYLDYSDIEYDEEDEESEDFFADNAKTTITEFYIE